MKCSFKKLVLGFALICSLNTESATIRLKDSTFFLGARENQLTGVGLVSGLNTVGDKDPAQTRAAFANTLRKYNLNIPASSLTSKDIALVLVTAELPSSAKNGSRIDVTVSALGDANSLEGGVLAQTILFGIDDNPYATAQGAIAVGGFSLGGGGGATVQKNHPLTAQIIGGAIVERTVPETLVRGNMIDLVLFLSDFSNAARIAEAINERYPSSARAIDSGSVRVEIPESYQTAHVFFAAELEAIEFTPDTRAVVIINEKTGTVVATGRVKISSCAVAHGNIIAEISEDLEVSQPSPFAQTGQTTVVPRATTAVTEQQARMKAFPELPRIDSIAAAMNALAASPRDMMAIFQAMKQAGALQAELIVR